MTMLQTTLQAVRSILAADPSVNPIERNRLVSLLRQRPLAEERNARPTAPVVARIIRRHEVAQRLSVSLRTVDKMAKTGMLRKRTFPGRIRASGFLESDVAELLTGGVTTATDVTEGMA
jgi:predicted DNA-binding transcriptional regulator AlpA